MELSANSFFSSIFDMKGRLDHLVEVLEVVGMRTSFFSNVGVVAAVFLRMREQFQ